MAKNKIILIGGVVVVAVIIAIFYAPRYNDAEKTKEKQVATESEQVVLYSDNHPVQVIAVDKGASKQEMDNPVTNSNVQVWIE